MSRNPISVAFESVDATPSAAFRQQLRAQFIAAMLQTGVSDEVAVESVVNKVGLNGDGGDTVTVIDAGQPPRRRLKVVLGVAASISLVAALTTVILNHGSDSNKIDTSHDPAIAKSALILPDQLGSGWNVTRQFDGLTSRGVAAVASKVPECAPYVDYAFDSPRRKAVTAGRIFVDASSSNLVQWVYIFPTKAAATRAMDKIAEPSFVPCFIKFMDALAPALSEGLTSHSTAIEVPPLLAHGDRQIIVGQSTTYPGFGTHKAMNAFVQVGRGIVYVNPAPDSHDSLDPAGNLDRALSAATDALTTALDTSGR